MICKVKVDREWLVDRLVLVTESQGGSILIKIVKMKSIYLFLLRYCCNIPMKSIREKFVSARYGFILLWKSTFVDYIRFLVLSFILAFYMQTLIFYKVCDL